MVAQSSLFLVLALISTAVCITASAAGGTLFLTAKADLQRYWQNHVSKVTPMPVFLLNKASPLSASDYATFSRLAEQNLLSSHIPDLCRKANLLCTFPQNSATTSLLANHQTNSDPVFWPNRCFTYKFGYKCELSSTTADQKFENHIIRGLFFRESNLKPNVVMPMPHVTDKMHASSFLPRRITFELPFSIPELKQIFHAGSNNSRMSTVIADAVTECQELPSPDEMKRCVVSIEDMIDFATSVLGRNVAVRAMDATEAANGNIYLKAVKPIDGGRRVTNAVSCHRRLFPYLLYYCHAIPNVRLYEAEIVKMNSRAKIIQGTAICHLDTSSWTPGHGAFMALGSGPGKIEVCHWIFGDDMIWTAAN